MTALLEKVLAQALQLPDAEQDALAERVQQVLKEFQGKKTQYKRRPRFGSAKGMFTLTPGLGSPTESFLGSEEGQKALAAQRPPAKYGSAKGLGHMTEDFEEPLEEFNGPAIPPQPAQPKRRAGTATGTFWMSEDFDAPLEDFKDYT